MARRKVVHCGEGPLIRDVSGWQIAAGDPAKSLPKAADATVLAALKSERLVYADKTAAATDSVDDDAPKAPEGDGTDDGAADNASARLTLIQCARSLIETGDESTLISTGEPKVESLRESFIDSGGDPDFEITAALRDEVTAEARDIAPENDN